MILRIGNGTVFPRGTRSVETMLAVMMLGWGIVLLAQSDTFDISPNYVQFARWADERTWAIGFLSIASLRLFCLLMNDHVWWAPLGRTAGCVAGSLTWALIAVGFMRSGSLPTGLAVYIPAVIFELIAAWRAPTDYDFKDGAR